MHKIKLRDILFAVLVLMSCIWVSCDSKKKSNKTMQLFDLNWKYAIDNCDSVSVMTYNSLKWKPIDMPHLLQKDSFILKTDTLSDHIRVQPYLWYLKCFNLPQLWTQKTICIQFENPSSIQGLFINGVRVITNNHGSSNNSFDITPFLKLESENQIVIQVILSANESMLIDQSGTIGHIWLSITDPSEVQNSTSIHS